MRRFTAIWLGAGLFLIGLTGGAPAQELSGQALLEALRGGGLNIYFRHAETDWSQSDHVTKLWDWRSCDPKRMRQLSSAGVATAKRIGAAMRALKIPVGSVMSSEYCRAEQTANLLDLGKVTPTLEIMNMRAADYVGGRKAVIQRARIVLATAPPKGTNRVIVGHGNLLRDATDVYPDEAGSGVFRPKPGGDLGFELVATLTWQDWVRLAEP